MVRQYVSLCRGVAAGRDRAAGRGRVAAEALLAGRPTAGFEDVQAVADAVLNHRLILTYKARLDQVDAGTIVQRLLRELDATGLNLPSDLAVAEAPR